MSNNDFHEAVAFFKVHHFADDTNLTRKSLGACLMDHKDCYFLNQEMERLQNTLIYA